VRQHSAADASRQERRSASGQRGRIRPVCSLLAHGGTTAAWCSGPVRCRTHTMDHFVFEHCRPRRSNASGGVRRHDHPY